MKGLLKYDPIYRITEEWVETFRSFFDRDITIITETDEELLFWYDRTLFRLTNNGLEFNLSVVNLCTHPSIPYVKDKKAVDPEELALEILSTVKEDRKMLKAGRKSIDAMDEIFKKEMGV